MDEIVRFQTVGLRYGMGPEVLQDLSFTLTPGSFHFLTGESGAGKSSLMRLMYLAKKPTRGSVSLFGRDIASLSRDDYPALRRRIGVVFQEFRLLPHQTAFDNVALPLRVSGMREKEIKKHVEELLTWVGLEENMAAWPETLSGGQQQRVAIARAVIAQPKLLLADDNIGVRLIQLFEELNRLGTTVVIATHNKSLISSSLHPIMHLEGGRLSIEDREPEPAATVETLSRSRRL